MFFSIATRFHIFTHRCMLKTAAHALTRSTPKPKYPSSYSHETCTATSIISVGHATAPPHGLRLACRNLASRPTGPSLRHHVARRRLRRHHHLVQHQCPQGG